MRELLDLDAANGHPCWGTFDPVLEARRRYLGIERAPWQPCAAGCGRMTDSLVGGVPLHPRCPDPRPGWVPGPLPVVTGEAAPADAGAGTPGQGSAAAASAGRPIAAVAEPGEQLAAVLDAAGLWLPGAAGPVAVEWPRDAGEAWRLAEWAGVRQLWVHPGAHAALGLPERHGPNPQAPEDHPWARPAGYQCDPGGLAAWMNIRPAGGGQRRAVVLVGFENRARWAEAPGGRVLADAVAALAGALPGRCNYYYSPNETAAAVIRHHHRGGVQPARLPPPAVDRVVTHVASWSRVLADDEAECQWLHRYDLHGAQLATWSVKLGTGDPVHDPAPRWVPRRSKYTAGYHLASVPGEWRPDPRLPNLRRPWERARQERVWLPTPFLELLIDDLGAPVTLHESWTWPASSAWLEASGHSLRDARASLGAQADGCGKCAPCVARAVVKACYTSAIGNFARRRDDDRDQPDSGPAAAGEPQDPLRLVAPENLLQRPDVTDHIISKALCNDYRRYARVGAATGRWPVAISSDAVYYAADDADGPGAIPAGLVIGPGLGQYGYEATVLLAAVRDQLNTQGFTRAVERHLRGNR